MPRERTPEIELRALDEAYRAEVVRLFAQLADNLATGAGGERPEQKFVAGLRAARQARAAALKAVGEERAEG